MSSDLSQAVGSWGKRGTAGATIAGQLSFDNVSFSVAAKSILRNISFSMAPGEIVSILGPSGCGKTSLLRLAAGVSLPNSGRITLDGKEISGPLHQVVPERRNIGLMFQDFVLFPHLNVIDNVCYGLRSWGKAEAESAARHVLERVGMSSAAAQFPHQLSGGEQQRVALARAIAPRPQVLLMDEPFSGLDKVLRASVRGETIALLREMRATAVLVTHDPEEAMEVSDSVYLMREGRIVQNGTPQDLFLNPVDPEAGRFFSACSEFRGVVKSGRVSTVLGPVAVPDATDGEQVIIQFRPQNIVPDDSGREAYVKNSQFLGHHRLLTLIFSGSEQEILCDVPAEAAPQKGETAKFTIRLQGKKQAVLVFKKLPGVTIVQ